MVWVFLPLICRRAWHSSPKTKKAPGPPTKISTSKIVCLLTRGFFLIQWWHELFVFFDFSCTGSVFRNSLCFRIGPPKVTWHFNLWLGEKPWETTQWPGPCPTSQWPFCGCFKWPFQGWIVTSIWVIKRSLGKSWSIFVFAPLSCVIPCIMAIQPTPPP